MFCAFEDVDDPDTRNQLCEDVVCHCGQTAAPVSCQTAENKRYNDRKPRHQQRHFIEPQQILFAVVCMNGALRRTKEEDDRR